MARKIDVYGFVAVALLFITMTRILPAGASVPAKRIGQSSAATVIDDSVRTTLTRDLPRAVATSYDEGRISDAMALPHIHLALTRPAYLQAALDRLTRDQHVRGTAGYHHWLTPGDLRRYGPAQADIDRVTAWLTARGLTVNSVSPSGMSIDFSGRAGQVAAAFHTQLHFVTKSGEAHITTIAAPAIPAALAPLVTGVVLANFFPKPAVVRVPRTFTVPTSGKPIYAVGPADFTKIYNVTPLRGTGNLFRAPLLGSGITLAMVEQTLIRKADWETFRSAFKLAGYAGTLTLTHPAGCASPGTTADEDEAALDTEWSTAVAPAANIIEASCAGTGPFDFGVMDTLQNLVEHGTPATVFSISYEGDELFDGFAFQAMWTNLLQEGAAEGKAIFVASGDNGVSADEGSIDQDGLFVNGLADSAYNVSVGGTDFFDTALGENSTYWKQANGAGEGSALSYIPEIPWDNGCSNSIIRNYYKAPGAIEFCNSAPTVPLQNDIGGSGSQSIYYTKPDWQLTSIPGVPDDGVRDQPDVSLFAANGIWRHFYVYCMSDASEGGAPCDYTKTADVFANGAGGTSFAAPAFAGIAALVEQSLDLEFGGSNPLGNPAPVLYAVAKAQEETPLGLRGCNASLGNKISPICVFNYVTAGDNTEPCVTGTANCVSSALSTKGIGVLATRVGGRDVFSYPAHPVYSLATGLGSVNVTNLVYNYYPGL